MSTIRDIADNAVRASRALTASSTEQKNTALCSMADVLEENIDRIIEANVKDIDYAIGKGLSESLLDRLRLDAARIRAMATGLRNVASLPDPVGEITEENTRPNGLLIQRIRIPLGVIGMIYESRPNVTADASSLCLKSGNAVILRGGSEAFNSNKIIVECLRSACEGSEIPQDAIQLIADLDYGVVDEMLTLDDKIDLIIPRGGEGLINSVAEKSRIPVLKHSNGICHVYVDAKADLDKALSISVSSKVRRPSVCNSIETILIHEDVAATFLPSLVNEFKDQNVEIRGCERTKAITPDIESATKLDWSTEYLDYIVSIKVVDDLNGAIQHIEEYGSMHTDTIVTESDSASEEFVRRVNSSGVLVNADTGFNDGAELGLGAEIGISTTKLHAFGPMGLRELTTTKFVIRGSGQIRS
jgi:glutamate-5-semialdehyde dehydrogenase